MEGFHDPAFSSKLWILFQLSLFLASSPDVGNKTITFNYLRFTDKSSVKAEIKLGLLRRFNTNFKSSV